MPQGKRRAGGLLAIALVLAASGCAMQRKPGAAPATALARPALSAAYLSAACADDRVYRLANDASRVLVFVGKAGALSGAGHGHVMEVKRMRGFARISSRGAQADIVFPLQAIRVDPPALRNALGDKYADNQPGTNQRTGTHKNMLLSLDAGAYPWVHLAITRVASTTPSTLHIRITLHGQTGEISAPARVQTEAQAVVASGSFRVRQSAFGIEPYSILLGALRVKDWLRIRYHLVFNRWHPTDTSSCSTPH